MAVDSNSEKSKERQEIIRPEREPIKKEVSAFRQFISDVFLPEGEDDLKTYMGNMFIKYIKMYADNTVHYICSGELERDDYKRAKASDRQFSSYGSGRTNYDNFYGKRDRTYEASNRVKEFEFTNEEASDVLDDIAASYNLRNQVSVAEYYDACGYRNYDHTANNYGWTSIDTIRMAPLNREDARGNELFTIYVPRPTALPKRN